MHSLAFGIKIVLLSLREALALFLVCAQHGHLLIYWKVDY